MVVVVVVVVVALVVTVPVHADDSSDFVFSVDGRSIRADPDYLIMEWIEPVPPLRDKLRGHEPATLMDSSTGIPSDCESIASSTLSHVAALVAGDVVIIHGLIGARELNGCRGHIVRHVPCSARFEVRMEGVKGTKAIKAANLKTPQSYCNESFPSAA